MEPAEELIGRCRVPAGKKFRLEDHDPSWAGDPDVPKEERKAFAKESLSEDVSALAEAQDRLYASDTWSILMIFQAMDAAGKDSTIKHVMSGVNPQGCQVYSFKHPSVEELDHNFLWRYTRVLPERGRIGIFNRSYYEEVLIVRVHPELAQAERLPEAKINGKFWESRFEDINNLERHLTRNGTVILKFFLNIDKEEQSKRFLKRLNDPRKHWKFNPADLTERGYWDAYMDAYEQSIAATSTKWAPWYVIPANHKWVARALVARILVSAIDGLNVSYPEVTPAQQESIEAARKQLEAEGE
ncbi:Polyphosphate kinase 2 (PPK2) [Aquisphaera giovannonii]|uniref:Polyphosphate kinase 2 (PPK2) n=1 Tax=Aquisphaera giovannonii TaxID=406548 RepID=A0A5B9W540_9BACT|nr:polyphosphate kinase 2 family protein [Aquisphaera giovannonii]QEH35668.1 Polyphosphate kinase 2 (PPK2) [Aquisphaera giovannonii]